MSWNECTVWLNVIPAGSECMVLGSKYVVGFEPYSIAGNPLLAARYV